MNTSLILLALACGAVSGLIYGASVLILVEPYLDQAIEIENQSLFASGEEQDTAQFRADYNEYRMWQKSGMILGSLIMGVAFGALFCAVFVLFRKKLPGRSAIQKSMILAGGAWVVMYLAPFIKYPPNPPASGDPETLVLRTILMLSLVAILGVAGLLSLHAYSAAPRRLGVILAGLGAVFVVTMVLMPASPDEPSQMPDMAGFLATSAISMTIYWVIQGFVLGVLWDRYMKKTLPPLA